MEVVISGKKLGTLDHLAHDGKRFRWVREIPENSWTFGFKDHSRDIELIAKASGRSITDFYSSPHGRANSIIFEGRDVDVPWMHVLPHNVFHKLLSGILDQLWCVLNEEYDGYYMNQFLINRELLETLQQPHIDVSILKKISRDEKNSREILKFLPKSGQAAPKSVYSQTGSVTGRLTVKHGPNILTLKKEYREILKSRFTGGKIIQIDISSLEPRIALAIAKKGSPEDVYNFIGESVLKNKLTRAQVKIAVLSCMYGASAWTLSKNLPEELDAREILYEIKRYFKISNLKSKLEKEISSLGHIRNVYGRPILSDESVVNHFLQSSGVDVSFNVFSQVIADISDAGISFFPIYIIHDAIVLDVDSKQYNKIVELTSQGYKVDKLDCIFPVKVEVIKE